MLDIIFLAQPPLVGKASSLSRLYDHTQLGTPHSVGLLLTSDQPDADNPTWQPLYMSPAGFEPTIPAN